MDYVKAKMKPTKTFNSLDKTGYWHNVYILADFICIDLIELLGTLRKQESQNEKKIFPIGIVELDPTPPPLTSLVL